MGACFKLTIIDKEGEVRTGSAFFVAEHYLLTCGHTIHALSPGDKADLCYYGTNIRAELKDVSGCYDIALLYTKTLARPEWIFQLDRVAPEGKKAVAYGYPHGRGLDKQSSLEIGAEVDDGYAVLINANGVTVGFSGGPVCRVSDSETAVGVVCTIEDSDKYIRRIETAGFVPARVVLEMWGEQYGLWEKRFYIKSDAYRDSSFVYSALKTDFQDPYGYLGQLKNFMEDNRSILWWAVVGQGGAGKSRLCYELARSLNSYWHCEVLRSGQLKKSRLQDLYEDAGKDFLLLADYAYTDTDELGKWLDERACEGSPRRIRVLLLQRENGREDYGWQGSLLSSHRNLINLRYHDDLKIDALKPSNIIRLMSSYAENVGGLRIDADALYSVLQKVDPDLTRPLFAMFIVDAVLHGNDPREWDPIAALDYFARREKDIIDRALGSSQEDVRVAELLLALATIANGFVYNVDVPESTYLHDIKEFVELDKEGFGSRLNNAGLADWSRRNGYDI